MIKVLIIADDFTGALDTGIQFAKCGIETQVIVSEEQKKDVISETAEVLVIDSETRAKSGDQAYRIISAIVEWAVNSEIPIIFKKTDSALRGNIGAELKAVIDTVREKRIFFFPAYPELNRITKRGIHYIDDQLLENSAFGLDPFEPVLSSDISKLIHIQCEYPVVVIEQETSFSKEQLKENTIYLFDADSTEYMERRAAELKHKDELKVIAGCAGLARCLPPLLKMNCKKPKKIRKTDGLYVACGSLNPITKEQIEHAVSKGGIRVNLLPEQKLEKKYYSTPEGKDKIKQIEVLCKNEAVVIVDTFDMECPGATADYAEKKNISKDQIRYMISECHGTIVKSLIEKEIKCTILMTGGDTLMGVMKVLEGAQLHPVNEIAEGVVVSILEWKEREIQIISKSGGFGDKNIITSIADKIIERHKT